MGRQRMEVAAIPYYSGRPSFYRPGAIRLSRLWLSAILLQHVRVVPSVMAWLVAGAQKLQDWQCMHLATINFEGVARAGQRTVPFSKEVSFGEARAMRALVAGFSG